jgi:hypothetical protein
VELTNEEKTMIFNALRSHSEFADAAAEQILRIGYPGSQAAAIDLRGMADRLRKFSERFSVR